MANVDFRLKVSVSSYQQKIATLEGYLGELDSLLERYENKKTELDSFMDGSDDNYESLLALVEENVKAVRTAKSQTEKSLEILRTTLENMQDFGSTIINTINTGAETAVNLVSEGSRWMNILYNEW